MISVYTFTSLNLSSSSSSIEVGELNFKHKIFLDLVYRMMFTYFNIKIDILHEVFTF